MPVLSLLVFNLSLHWVPIVLYAFAVDFAVDFAVEYAYVCCNWCLWEQVTKG